MRKRRRRRTVRPIWLILPAIAVLCLAIVFAPAEPPAQSPVDPSGMAIWGIGHK